jgi:hypothetical protein
MLSNQHFCLSVRLNTASHLAWRLLEGQLGLKGYVM